jgi:hypothetical protein
MSMERHGEMILTGKLKNSAKTCHSTMMPTTNPIWTDMDMNPGLCGERPVTNHLSQGRDHSNYNNYRDSVAKLSNYWLLSKDCKD